MIRFAPLPLVLLFALGANAQENADARRWDLTFTPYTSGPRSSMLSSA